MKHKKSQIIMVWFLPLIVIGGMFYPIIGYLVVAMMAFLLSLSFFKGRFWCWNLCPRGSFLDIVLSRVSRHTAPPKIFSNKRFRWFIFFMFLGFVAFRVTHSWGDFIVLGAVFVMMCLVTTVISIILGVATKHRGWCMICPMGTLQDRLGKVAAKKKVDEKL